MKKVEIIEIAKIMPCFPNNRYGKESKIGRPIKCEEKVLLSFS